MSLLLDHGHPDARLYPLGMLHDESQLVIERINGKIITEATLIQLAVSSILSKPARKQFSKVVKQLNVETRPRQGLFDEGTDDGP